MATLTLTATDFESTVLGNDIVLVDFWAAWCGPCRNFAPVFESASEVHSDVVFGKVDTEAEQALAAAAQITSIPTLMAFREGVLVFAQPGALPARRSSRSSRRSAASTWTRSAPKSPPRRAIRSNVSDVRTAQVSGGTSRRPPTRAGASHGEGSSPLDPVTSLRRACPARAGPFRWWDRSGSLPPGRRSVPVPGWAQASAAWSGLPGGCGADAPRR